MDTVWYLVLIALLLVGVFLNILTAPGIWVMVAASIGYAWITHWQYLGPWGLAVLGGIAILAEIIETRAGGAGAKKAGGSRRAAWGALIGGIAGAIFLSIPLPVIGTIIGACIGVFVGALAAELTVRGDTEQSLAVGYGAARGKLIGILTKIAFSLLLLILAAILGFPHHKAHPTATRPAAMLSKPR